MDEPALNEAIVRPILNGCNLDLEDWETIFGWATNAGQRELRTIDMTRGGVNPWAEYPSADAVETTEVVDGAECLHYGGEPEKDRVRHARRTERETTDDYMKVRGL